MGGSRGREARPALGEIGIVPFIATTRSTCTASRVPPRVCAWRSTAAGTSTPRQTPRAGGGTSASSVPQPMLGKAGSQRPGCGSASALPRCLLQGEAGAGVHLPLRGRTPQFSECWIGLTASTGARGRVDPRTGAVRHRVTVPSAPLLTHTRPPSFVMPAGVDPTRTLTATRPVRGSTPPAPSAGTEPCGRRCSPVSATIAIDIAQAIAAAPTIARRRRRRGPAAGAASGRRVRRAGVRSSEESWASTSS